jgi:hypothetical protein
LTFIGKREKKQNTINTNIYLFIPLEIFIQNKDNKKGIGMNLHSFSINILDAPPPPLQMPATPFSPVFKL